MFVCTKQFILNSICWFFLSENPNQILGNRGQPYPGGSVNFSLSSGSASYIGMRDLLPNDEETGTVSRPVSTSTTFSIVESISESRDTIYEVRGDVLRHQETSPRYTNSSVFSVETARRLNQKLSSIRSGVSFEDSDADDYNYPYADLSTLRLPEGTESTRLSTCSDDTEYVVVLKQDQGDASYTPYEMKGKLREAPSGMSFSELASTSALPVPKTIQRLGEAWGGAGMKHYQVPCSPPVKRIAAPPCNKKYVRSYVTSVKNLTDSTTGLRRGSGHRQTRRVKAEIVQCPPPPPCNPPDVHNTHHVYVNDRSKKTISNGRQSNPCTRKAPPIPKPRPRLTCPTCPTKTEDTEITNSETQGKERFI